MDSLIKKRYVELVIMIFKNLIDTCSTSKEAANLIIQILYGSFKRVNNETLIKNFHSNIYDELKKLL